MTRYTLLILTLGLAACAGEDPAPAGGFSLPEGLSSSTAATDADGNTYTVGFDQATSINQNPFVEKKDAGGTTVWRVTHENTPVDCRANLVMVDGDGAPWVAFSLDGGSNDGGYITQKEVEAGAFSGVFLNSYGSGGGPKVAVVARLNPETGAIVKGTFLTARLTSGDTNTLRLTAMGSLPSGVAVAASTAAWPPAAGTSWQRFPGIADADRTSGSFIMYYELNTALSEIVVAEIDRP